MAIKISYHVLQLSSICVACLISLTACSSVTNTIAGLTTPQATISGSNYVFFVDPKTGRLQGKQPDLPSPKHIHAGDYFQVAVDFGFLRYLQAVDPYVIVYSETWMGSDVRPMEGDKTLRQVVLIKEGLAQNARLPITSVPLLGPVTMGQDLLDVHVTLKVVVLSKRDNAQTIQLVEGVAGLASAAAPQYAMAAGAAAAAVAAFIAQNRDKVEFEHTFTLSPDGLSLHVTPLDEHSSRLTLQEGQIAVLKGESRFRVVPYHTWYYYLWPFNWFGLSPDQASRRFEPDERPRYSNLGDLIRLPAYAVAALFTDAEGDAIGLDWLDKRLAPDYELTQRRMTSASPDVLLVDGYQILNCSRLIEEEKIQQAKTDKKDAEEESWYEIFWYPIIHGFSEEKKGLSIDSVNRQMSNCRFEVRRERERAGIFPINLLFMKQVEVSNIFSQKTHFVLSVNKTKGTLGGFEEVRSKHSVHSAFIKEVSTSSSEANTISNERVKAAFTSVEHAILFERAKRSIRDDARKGIQPSSGPALDAFLREHKVDKEKQPREVASLIDSAIDTMKEETVAQNIQCVDKAFGMKNVVRDAQTTSEQKPGDRKKAFEDSLACIKGNIWDWSKQDTQYWPRWEKGWQGVLAETKRAIFKEECTTIDECFVSREWKELEDTPNALLKTAVPTVTVTTHDGTNRIVEGHVGTTALTLAVSITPPAPTEVKIGYATEEMSGASAARVADQDFEPVSGTLAIPPNSGSGRFSIGVKGDQKPESDETFLLKLTKLAGNVDLAPSGIVLTILNDDSEVSVSGPSPIVEGNDGTTDLKFILTVKPANKDRIRLAYRTADDSAKAGTDYLPVSDELFIEPGKDTAEILVTVRGNSIKDGNRQFKLILEKLWGPAQFAGGAISLEAVGEIADDD
ncbi:MAG: Calx-beta domain-containing protein [Nitrospiraceae bacterium]